MKKILIFVLLSFVLIISACAPATSASPAVMPSGNNSSDMSDMSTEDHAMTLAPGASAGVTATPGSMSSNSEMGHSMEPITAPNAQPATQTEGGQPLEFREENGVKVFELTAKAVQWPILDGVTVTAYSYNGTVPGPMIRVAEGDQVKIIVKNELPDPTTIHWHGVEVPNAMDGVPGVTQDPIQPGETFTYEFTAKPAGTFMYHSHFEGDVQVSAGLYAPLVIDPKEPEANPPAVDEVLMISESLVRGGQTTQFIYDGDGNPSIRLRHSGQAW